MSLINDALRQAKQAQQDAAAPPAPNLELRPIEPGQQIRHSVGLLWPAALLVVALLLLLLVWQQGHRPAQASVAEVNARAAAPGIPAPAPQPAPIPVVATPAPSPIAEPVPPAVATSSANATNSAQIAAVTLSYDRPDSINPDDGLPNIPAPAEAQPPKPAPPKLQAIIFSPTRPCVMISGKTLFVGDKLEELRVATIEKTSVTLIGAGQTNVLRLSE
jgi:hypothetical protein